MVASVRSQTGQLGQEVPMVAQSRHIGMAIWVFLAIWVFHRSGTSRQPQRPLTNPRFHMADRRDVIYDSHWDFPPSRLQVRLAPFPCLHREISGPGTSLDVSGACSPVTILVHLVGKGKLRRLLVFST